MLGFVVYIYFYKGLMTFFFWLRWAFAAARGFPLVAVWGLLFTSVCRLLTVVASLVVEHGL